MIRLHNEIFHEVKMTEICSQSHTKSKFSLWCLYGPLKKGLIPAPVGGGVLFRHITVSQNLLLLTRTFDIWLVILSVHHIAKCEIEGVGVRSSDCIYCLFFLIRQNRFCQGLPPQPIFLYKGALKNGHKSDRCNLWVGRNLTFFIICSSDMMHSRFIPTWIHLLKRQAEQWRLFWVIITSKWKKG